MRYNNTCDELLQQFKKDIKTEFGDITITEGISNSGTKFMQINRKHVIQIFLNQLSSFKSDDIYVPDSIKNSNIEIQREYLRAFFDDEGSPSLRLTSRYVEWKRGITLCSNSLAILNDIKYILLTSFGIKTNNIYKNKPHDSKDRCYVLSITGFENYLIFRDKIGFNHPLKKERLELMITSYTATPKDVLKFNDLKNKLIKLKRDGQLSVLPARSAVPHRT